MRQLVTFLALLTISFSGWSQGGDTPKTKPLKIEVVNEKEERGKTKKDNPLNIPSIVGNDPEINFKDSLKGRKPVKMHSDRELMQAGTGRKIDPKVGRRKKNKEGSKDYFGDMYLGDINSNSKFIGIVCRDGGIYIDGDRIRVLLNNKIIDRNIRLTESSQGINIDLKKGLNQIEFEALNEGSISPNSARIDVYDDKGILIFSNTWLLSEGSKARLIITNE